MLKYVTIYEVIFVFTATFMSVPFKREEKLTFGFLNVVNNHDLYFDWTGSRITSRMSG